MESALNTFSQSPFLKYLSDHVAANKTDYVPSTSMYIPHIKRKVNLRCDSFNNTIDLFTKTYLQEPIATTRIDNHAASFYTSSDPISFEIPSIGFMNSAMLKMTAIRENLIATTEANALGNSGVPNTAVFPFFQCDSGDDVPENFNPDYTTYTSELNVVRLVEKIELRQDNKIVETLYPESIVSDLLSKCSSDGRLQWKRMMTGLSNVYNSKNSATASTSVGGVYNQICSPTAFNSALSCNVTMFMPITFSMFSSFHHSIDSKMMKKFKILIYPRNLGVTLVRVTGTKVVSSLNYEITANMCEYQSLSDKLIRELKLSNKRYIGTTFNKLLPFRQDATNIMNTNATLFTKDEYGFRVYFDLSTYPGVIKNIYFVMYPSQTNMTVTGGSPNLVLKNQFGAHVPQGNLASRPMKFEIMTDETVVQSFNDNYIFENMNLVTHHPDYESQSYNRHAFMGVHVGNAANGTGVVLANSISSCIYKLPFYDAQTNEYAGGIPYYATDAKSHLRATISYSPSLSVVYNDTSMLWRRLPAGPDSCFILIESYYVGEVNEDGSVCRLLDF